MQTCLVCQRMSEGCSGVLWWVRKERPGFPFMKIIKMPALIIHGEWDSIVPLTEGEKIYSHIGSTDKKMLVIEGADHNTIFMVGEKLYLQELAAFIILHK